MKNQEKFENQLQLKTERDCILSYLETIEEMLCTKYIDKEGINNDDNSLAIKLFTWTNKLKEDFKDKPCKYIEKKLAGLLDTNYYNDKYMNAILSDLLFYYKFNAKDRTYDDNEAICYMNQISDKTQRVFDCMFKDDIMTDITKIVFQKSFKKEDIKDFLCSLVSIGAKNKKEVIKNKIIYSFIVEALYA